MLIRLSAVVMLALAPLAHAQPDAARKQSDRVEARLADANDPDFRDPTNAALLYYRAMLLLPEETSNQVNAIINQDNPAWTPGPEVSQKIADAQSVSLTLMRAAKIESCDFGVEYSQGIGALLPHLGKLRAGARFLAADSRRLIQGGGAKPDDAAERIAAMFAMSRHLSRERLMISALVCNAIHTLACTEMDHLIASGRLTATGKRTLTAALERFNTPDPFGIRASIRGERYWVVVWLRAQLAGPDGVKVFLEQVLPAFGEKPSEADMKMLTAMDAGAITADLDKSERYYSSVLEVFDLPDAPSRLGALEKGVKDGEFGIIAKHAAPALGRVHQQYLKAAVRQNDARARLEAAIARPD